MRLAAPTLVFLLTSLASGLGYSNASALDSTGRDQGWTLGLGIGMGRAQIEYLDGSLSEKFSEGVNTEWRLGKMINRHLALTFDYQGWMLEDGDLNRFSARFRQGLQIWGLGATWYPGNPENAWGGLVIRGTAGAALANFAITELDDDLLEVEEERLDEWGYGLGLTAGYEFFVTEKIAVGPTVNYGYLMIDEALVETGHWLTLTVLGSWYF